MQLTCSRSPVWLRGSVLGNYPFNHCTSAALGLSADTHLRVLRGELAEEVQDGGGEDGVDAEEEVDAHVGDEGHLRILEHA